MTDIVKRLLPCPFCGEKEIFLNEPSQFYRYGAINCPACLVAMPGATSSTDELINAWNVRAVSQTAWQPIETAPKDGTPLLLGWPRFLHPLVGHCEDGVWGQLESDFGFEAFQSQPAHWMPLPAGPALSSAERPEGGQ